MSFIGTILSQVALRVNSLVYKKTLFIYSIDFSIDSPDTNKKVIII